MPTNDILEPSVIDNHNKNDKPISQTDSINNDTSNEKPYEKKSLSRLLSSRSLSSSSCSLNTLSLTSTNDSSLDNDISNTSSTSSTSSSDLSSSITSLKTASYQSNNTHLSSPLIDFYYKNQITPKTTSILKPGSKFIGSQQSGISTYEVEVELQHVDLDNSYMNGYLTIQGLTESHPEIITFFESEIISERHSFFTNESSWGSNMEIDLQHWSKFPDWKKNLPTKKIIDNSYMHKDFMNHKFIYMRWKEKFLVPDSQIDNIEGASFAGFYYIQFNQINGNINGLYYHKSSEKFQQLELSYVPTNGVGSSYQFM